MLFRSLCVCVTVGDPRSFSSEGPARVNAVDWGVTQPTGFSVSVCVCVCVYDQRVVQLSLGCNSQHRCLVGSRSDMEVQQPQLEDSRNQSLVFNSSIIS